MHTTSGYLHAFTIRIVIRSAEWHRDGDLIGLARSSNHFTAASALCRHRAMTPVWLFVLHCYKHRGSDLSLSHRCHGFTDSPAESRSKLSSYNSWCSAIFDKYYKSAACCIFRHQYIIVKLTVTTWYNWCKYMIRKTLSKLSYISGIVDGSVS